MVVNDRNRALAYAAFYGRGRMMSSFRGFNGFGDIGITGSNCPVPPSGGFLGPGQPAIDAWCNCMFPIGTHAEYNKKCKGFGVGSPWTATGKATRGLPANPEQIWRSIQEAANVVTNTIVPSVQQMTQPSTAPAQSGSADWTQEQQRQEQERQRQAEETIFGLPKKAAMIGGGILALGIAAVFMSKK